MTHRSVIETVRETLGSFEGLQMHYDPETEPAREGRFVSLRDSRLHSSVIDFLERTYPDGLFCHQHEAIENVLHGRNTVVATRTSSGKSLIYALPVFDTLCRDPSATALFIYPHEGPSRTTR